MARTQQTAFTLVELLVVIGILSVLIAMLMPALQKVRVAAVQTQCMSNHRTLAQAVAMYANQFGYAPRVAYQDKTQGNLWVHWRNQPMLGQFIGNTSPNIEKDDTTTVIYCPAYRTVNKSSGSRSNLGIGINQRNGAFISRSEGSNRAVKYSHIRRSSQVFIFVDVYSYHGWEKFYYNEPWPANNMGSGTAGMMAYRHGKNAVVSFSDGHAEIFSKQTDDLINGMQDQGLHRAYQLKQVFFRASGN